MGEKTKKLVVSAMMTALTCVFTAIIKIPSPLKGYINPGDCVVLTAGWLLPPTYSFAVAGLGSAMADIFSGYTLYAPATFIIKGLMSITAFMGFKLFHNKLGNTPSRIIGGAVAEIVMIAGYWVFEGLQYGFIPSAVNIPPNAVQGAVGLVLGLLLMKTFEKSKINLF